MLRRQWYGELDGTPYQTWYGESLFVFNLATFGFFAPKLLTYRSADLFDESYMKNQGGIEVEKTTCHAYIQYVNISNNVVS